MKLIERIIRRKFKRWLLDQKEKGKVVWTIIIILSSLLGIDLCGNVIKNNQEQKIRQEIEKILPP